MKRKINVLYLLTAFVIGGAEKVVARTVRKLDRAKYNITVAALTVGSGRLIDELKSADVQIINLDMRFKYDIRILGKLYSLLKKERIDLIYAYLFHPILLGTIIGKALRIPIILHSLQNIPQTENPLRLKLYRLVSRYSDMTTPVSEAVRLQYQNISKSRLFTIYNSINVDQYACERKPLTGSKVVIGCTGRLHEKNGHLHLIEAASILDNRKLCYRFVGSGEEETKLKELVKQKHLDDCINFVGFRYDIPRQLAMLDIYVQPSLYEGLPNSVLEAMASGLPVIATDVGGTSEAIIDGKTGLLIPPKDAKAIAEKITYLIEHPDVARRIGCNAKAYVKRRFSIESMVRKTEELFETMISEKLGLKYDETLQQWSRWATDLRK